MKKIKLSPSNKLISIADNQTILEALEENGLMLPNNCRAGACGECKIKVLKGEFDQGLVLDMALSKAEREEGIGLMCMAKAISTEIELEWGEEDAKPKLFEPQENKPYCVIDKRVVTESIVKLELRTLGKVLRFWPGQYLKLTDSKKNIKEGIYSIANTSNELGIIELYVEKTLDNENNNWVHDQLTEGDTVYISGAYGEFIGNPNIEKPVLCLGEGVGLAPMMSLAQGALIRGGFRKSATVIEFSDSQKNVIGKGPFLFLDKKFRNFHYKLCLENNIENFFNENGFSELNSYSIYIAGRSKFVKNITEVVNKFGADKNSLFIENFNF